MYFPFQNRFVMWLIGTNLPVALLLLPLHLGIALASLSIGSCLWACWHIANRRPGVWRLALVACVIALFWPWLWYYMSSFEFCCMILTAIFQGLGTTIFVNKWPDPWPSFFGYHEVFHIFTVFGMLSIFFCNWSIIRRTCNPYARHTDVLELLISLYLESAQKT
jgi:hemolysin III